MDAYSSIHEKAAAMLHSLVRNHPFYTANKRTAVTSLFVLYRLNGWILDLTNDELLALAIDVAEGIVDVAEIAKRLAETASEDPALDL
jgi:death-on-curing protein